MGEGYIAEQQCQQRQDGDGDLSAVFPIVPSQTEQQDGDAEQGAHRHIVDGTDDQCLDNIPDAKAAVFRCGAHQDNAQDEPHDQIDLQQLLIDGDSGIAYHPVVRAFYP